MSHDKNSKVLKSLCWMEKYISYQQFKPNNSEYSDIMYQLVIDMYEDFFIGKHHISHCEKLIITGIIKRRMGFAFTLENSLERTSRYFFSNDIIED